MKDKLTYEVTNIEGVVVGPKSVVDARVPSLVGTNNVISGGCRRDYPGSSGEEEAEEDERH